MSLNIGNADTSDKNYALRIMDQAYEDYVGEVIQRVMPDIIGLQEVLPPTVCYSFKENNSSRTCYAADHRPPPVRRILGDAYTIVCDSRRHVECIGVRVDFGTIRGVEPGSFHLNGAVTVPLPMRACEYERCKADRQECDSESAIASIVVDTDRGPLRVVHAHPTAIGKQCRQHQVRQAFEIASEDQDTPAVLLGDWNFDPSRTVDMIETAVWNKYVGPARRFNDHSSVDQNCDPLRTSSGRDANLDRVVTDFALGSCNVMQDPTIDQGYTALRERNRIDHYAVHCALFDPRQP